MSDFSNTSRFFHRASSSHVRGVHFTIIYGIPILNIILLASLCVAASARLVAIPAIPFKLPEAEYMLGSTSSYYATLLIPPGNPTPTLFFDGQSYRIENDDECAALQKSFRAMHDDFGMNDFTLFADARSTHAAVVRVAAEARRAGIENCYIAVSAPTSTTPRQPSAFSLFYRPSEPPAFQSAFPEVMSQALDNAAETK